MAYFYRVLVFAFLYEMSWLAQVKPEEHFDRQVREVGEESGSTSEIPDVEEKILGDRDVTVEHTVKFIKEEESKESGVEERKPAEEILISATGRMKEIIILCDGVRCRDHQDLIVNSKVVCQLTGDERPHIFTMAFNSSVHNLYPQEPQIVTNERSISEYMIYEGPVFVKCSCVLASGGVLSLGVNLVVIEDTGEEGKKAGGELEQYFKGAKLPEFPTFRKGFGKKLKPLKHHHSAGSVHTGGGSVKCTLLHLLFILLGLFVAGIEL